MGRLDNSNTSTEDKVFEKPQTIKFVVSVMAYRVSLLNGDDDVAERDTVPVTRLTSLDYLFRHRSELAVV